MNKLKAKPEEPDNQEELDDLESDHSEIEDRKLGRKRRRIKVRRRIRIKKRTSPKKKAKKTMETIAWILIIAAFIVTLIIMILQLDLNDKRTKNWRGKPVSLVYSTPFSVSNG